ncbi:MAG: GAF domain-containing sensor histidine kinase [Actinobacteria bacterium]|nr:GAF domain-containing sensor histidine kinase [Actinomycetota bacterium]
MRVLWVELALRTVLVSVWVAALWSTGSTAPTTRWLLTVGVGLLYLPVTAMLARRPVAGGWVVPQLLVIATDLALGAAGAYLVPAWRISVLFLYLVLVVTTTISDGGRRGLGVAALATAAAAVLGLTGGARDAVSLVALVPFVVCAFGLPVLISQLVSEHRRHAEHLARLHQALASIAATPDLAGTFDAISDSARRAVGGALVALMTLDAAGETLSARAVAAGDATVPELALDSIELATTLPAWSPTQLAARTGRPVVVVDPSTETRFGRWASDAAEQGVTAMVAVPLRTGETVIGTLNAYWSGDRGPSREDVDLLAAYAEGASLSILRAEAYEQERRAAAALRATELERSEFTASIAHELRTPLTTIRGFIETMLVREDVLTPADRHHMLEVSRRNAVDLTHRIAALLEHSKLEGDHVRVDPRVQPLRPVVATALDNCSGLLTRHRLVVDVPDGLLVDVDEVALDHILANLVSNGVKYAPAGSDLTVRAAPHDTGEVVVSVEDRGIGIPAADVPHVFDRFYRGGDQGRRSGTGLGLAIVKGYVELSGGRIWIDSVEGEGTAFRFTLPLASTVVAPDSVAGPPPVVPGALAEVPTVDPVDHRVEARDEPVGVADLDEVRARPSAP